MFRIGMIILAVLSLGSLCFTVAMAASAAAAGTIAEPIVTWNLYVSPAITTLGTALTLLFVNRRINQSDKKDERIQNLLDAREGEKQKELDEWRRRYTDAQCGIKTAVDDLKESIVKIEKGKTDWSHCQERRREVDSRLRKGGL